MLPIFYETPEFGDLPKYLAEIEKLVEQEKFTEAEKLAEEALKVYKDDPDLLFLLGDAYLGNYKLEEAERIFKRLSSDDVYKINASKALIEYVLIDSRVRDAMIAIVDAYLDEIKQKSEQEGDFDSLYALYDSARSYGGESNEEIVKVFEADSSFVDRKVEYETIQKEQRIIEGLIVEGEVDKAIEKLNLIEGSVEKDFSFLNPEQTSPLSTFQIPSLESMNERLNEAISESLERQ